MKFPKRGEIHWAKIPGQPDDTKERPVLVVSGDSRNQFADDIIVIPLSTTLRLAPTHVCLPAGSGGLPQTSMAKCELVTTLDKIFLIRGPARRTNYCCPDARSRKGRYASDWHGCAVNEMTALTKSLPGLFQ